LNQNTILIGDINLEMELIRTMLEVFEMVSILNQKNVHSFMLVYDDHVY
jgi:hypothetical protein